MPDANLKIVRERIEQMMPQIEQPAQGKILHPWLSVTAGDHYVSTNFVWDF